MEHGSFVMPVNRMNAARIGRKPARARQQPLPNGKPFTREQHILDSLQAQIAVLDKSGYILLVNKAWREFSRRHHCFWAANTRPGVNYLQLCRDQGARGAVLLRGVRSILTGRRAVFSCDLHCDASGKEAWFHLSLSRLAGPEPAVVLSFTNITEQKRGDAAKARLAAIVESSNDAITATGLDGMVTSWNKGAKRLYGYSAREIIGRPLNLVIPVEKRAQLRKVLQAVKSGRHVPPLETLRRHKSGRLIPVTVNVSAVKNDQGEIIALSGIARDVSERRRLEAEVLHAAEREQRRIAQDLHDGLTQQITGVACLASVLAQQLKAQGSTHADEAQRIAHLLADAGEQTRDLSRGLYPVRPQPNGLTAALDSLAIRTSELFRLDCQFHCHHPVLVKDVAVANHLYRIAQEAVANAVRHGRASRIDIHLSGNREKLIIGVADNGVGIRHGHRMRKGIGLRIMSYRAELISGTLLVQRRAEGGTEVVCTVNRHPYGP